MIGLRQGAAHNARPSSSSQSTTALFTLLYPNKVLLCCVAMRRDIICKNTGKFFLFLLSLHLLKECIDEAIMFIWRTPKEEEMWVYRSGARPMNNVIGGEGKS